MSPVTEYFSRGGIYIIEQFKIYVDFLVHFITILLTVDRETVLEWQARKWVLWIN